MTYKYTFIKLILINKKYMYIIIFSFHGKKKGRLTLAETAIKLEKLQKITNLIRNSKNGMIEIEIKTIDAFCHKLQKDFMDTNKMNTFYSSL